MILKCGCCGFSAKFEDAEAAFELGWDCPPYFTGYIACDLCPAVSQIEGLGFDHTATHERWEREGRPETFSEEDCPEPHQRTRQETGDKLVGLMEGIDIPALKAQLHKLIEEAGSIEAARPMLAAVFQQLEKRKVEMDKAKAN